MGSTFEWIDNNSLVTSKGDCTFDEICDVDGKIIGDSRFDERCNI
jgi:hypothetical protein